MSYNTIKKIIVVIGDENIGEEDIGNESLSSLFYNINIDKTCKVFKIDNKKNVSIVEAFPIDENGNRKKNCSIFSLGVLNELKDNGFYILEINKEVINLFNSESEIRNSDLDIISSILIGTEKEQYKDGLILKIKDKLKTENIEDNIVEIPEFSVFFYSGGVRDCNQNIENYKRNIASFISNLNYFLPTQGLQQSFIFVDNICNIASNKTLCENEDSISFSFKNELKDLQRTLNSTTTDIWGKYFALDNNNLNTSKKTYKEKIRINGKEYSDFIGYTDDSGKIIYSKDIPGFLYDNDAIKSLFIKFSEFIYNDVLSLSGSFIGTNLKWISPVNEFDEAFLFKKGTGRLSIEDLKNLNPAPSDNEFSYSSSTTDEEDKKMIRFKGNVVGNPLNKISSKIFKSQQLEEKISFSHILFYNSITNTQTDGVLRSLSAFVEMGSIQNINLKSKIKLTLRRDVKGSTFIDVQEFSINDVDFSEHSLSKYNLVDTTEEKELGIIDGETANEEAGISDIGFNEKNINDFSERSNRLTNDIKKSGDSLYINEEMKLYRDRDNSVYCPYFLLPEIEVIEDEINFEEDKKHIKMFFDARFGLLFWRLCHFDDNVSIIVYFTTGKSKSYQKYDIGKEVGGSVITDLEKEYKNPIDRIRISLAVSDLIINISGKVYKVQRSANGKDSFTGVIYPNKNGYIIFPAWYDLWNIAYIVNGDSVKFIDCSGEEFSLNNFKELEDLAYVENFPGPKKQDYKNIIANYLIGGLTLKELLLQGARVEDLSIYDSAVVNEPNTYKIDIYPLSYKYSSKQSILKKRFENDSDYSIVKDLFINNEGFGMNIDNKWYYSWFIHELNKEKVFNDVTKVSSIIDNTISYSEKIEKENLTKILSSRGLRIGVFENPNRSLSLKLI